MGINVKAIAIHMKTSTAGSMKFIRNHPFLVVTLILSLLAYAFLPPEFASFVLSSPVIVCTFLLLAILLSLRLRNVPDKTSTTIPSMKTEIATDDLVVKKSESVDARTNLKKRSGPPAEKADDGFIVGEKAVASEKRIHQGQSSDSEEPLLDHEAPQQRAPSSSNDDSENGSDAENQDDGEEDEEAQEDGTEAVVKWTADDEKNLKDLGTSELERNQRLENLIAKRIASKKQRAAAAAERDLIDLDSIDPLPVSTPVIDHFANMQIQVPPSHFTMNRNPFETAYSPIPGLPPVPGSAPSVLLPRRNPFDLPYILPQGGNPMAMTPIHAPPFDPILQRDMFFRRHENFSVGALAPTGMNQEMPQSNNLKPYFVAERFAMNEGGHRLQRRLGGDTDSGSSSDTESDTSSSVVDELDNVNEDEQKENESEEVDSMETQPDQSYVDDMLPKKTASNISNDTEKMHEDGSWSSSSWMQSNQKTSKTDVNEQSTSHQATGQGAISTPKIAPVRVVREVLETIDDGPVKEPVYDSSPSAVAKSSSNSFEGDLFSVGKGVSQSTSSAGVSTAAPVERTIPLDFEGVERTIPLDLEGPSKSIAFLKKNWVASTSLSFVDRNESRSRGISEVSEADVIQAVLDSSTEARPLEIHFVHSQSNSDVMIDATSSSENSGTSIDETDASPSSETGRQVSQEKPTDETSKDDIETKEITEPSNTIQMEHGNLRDKTASELVGASMNAVNKTSDGSSEVEGDELVKEIDQALKENEEIMKSALLESIDEKAISTDAQVGATGIDQASEVKVGSSASWTDKHALEPPAEILSDIQALEARSPEDILLNLKLQKSIEPDDGPVEDEESGRSTEPLEHTHSAAEDKGALKKYLKDDKINTVIEQDADNNKESIK